MNERDYLAERFEEHRTHLRAVAYRMLGSLSEVDDAVQDAMTGPSDEDAIVKRLYPDQATFKKEEQRRFEILDAHWDVPLNELALGR